MKRAPKSDISEAEKAFLNGMPEEQLVGLTQKNLLFKYYEFVKASIGSDDNNKQFDGIIALRRLQICQLFQNSIMEAQTITLLIDKMRSKQAIQIESLVIIAQYLSQRQTDQQLVEKQIIPLYADMLPSKDEALLEKVAKGIEIITEKGNQYSPCLSRCYIPALMNSSIQRIRSSRYTATCIRCFFNLTCRGSIPKTSKVIDIICYVCRLMTENKITDLFQLAQCFRIIEIHCREERVHQIIIGSGALSTMFATMMKSDENREKLDLSCIRVFSRIFETKLKQQNFIIEIGFLEAAQSLLYCSNSEVRMRVCQIIAYCCQISYGCYVLCENSSLLLLLFSLFERDCFKTKTQIANIMKRICMEAFSDSETAIAVIKKHFVTKIISQLHLNRPIFTVQMLKILKIIENLKRRNGWTRSDLMKEQERSRGQYQLEKLKKYSNNKAIVALAKKVIIFKRQDINSISDSEDCYISSASQSSHEESDMSDSSQDYESLNDAKNSINGDSEIKSRGIISNSSLNR